MRFFFYNFRRGLAQQQCIEEFNAIFGDEAPSRYFAFNRGHRSLQNEFRKGLPKSVVVPETINAVSQLILQDHHVTYREIETTLGIIGTIIHSTLHEHLTVKNVFALDPTQFVNCSKKKKNQSSRVTKVLRQLVQRHAKVFRS